MNVSCPHCDVVQSATPSGLTVRCRSCGNGFQFKIPNDQIVSAAKQFRLAANILFEPYHRLSRAETIPSLDSLPNCALPIRTMAAFGIELFLKSLNSVHVLHKNFLVTAKSSLGHPLLPLFRAIGTRFKNALEAVYKLHPVVAGKATIGEAIRVYSTEFEDSRYSFEMVEPGNNLNVTGLTLQRRNSLSESAVSCCHTEVYNEITAPPSPALGFAYVLT